VLFTLPEILTIIQACGLPDEGWETNVPSSLAHYIEAQVWNRSKLIEFKNSLALRAARAEHEHNVKIPTWCRPVQASWL
jgi:hypothetical protein